MRVLQGRRAAAVSVAFVLLGRLGLAGAASAEGKPPAPPPTLDAFYEDPLFHHAVLSPDGRYLAVAQGGTIRAVTLTDLVTGKTTPVVSLAAKGAAVKGLDVDWIAWKGDKRLIIGMTLLDIRREGNKPDGDVVAWRYGRFIFAVDRDGANQIPLMQGGVWDRYRASRVSLLDRLTNDPDHVLVTAPSGSGGPAVWKVDIHGGKAERIEDSALGVTDWGTDADGVVVTRLREVGSTDILEGRAPGQSRWTTIVKLRPKDYKAMPDFEVLGGAGKPGQLYVAVNPQSAADGDTRTLRIYDLAAKSLSAPIWPALKYDLTSIVTDYDTAALQGVCYYADVYVCDMKDPEVAANIRGISKYFHGERSLTPIFAQPGRRWWLFAVSGSDEPRSYYLFDWKTKQIAELAEEYAHLPSESLARTEPWTYASRDGAQIPAYLTRPKDAKGAMPLIVLPHGGPEMRDSLGYDRWVQYLATRGYLVFQPNFRGSDGYGRAFAAAGHHQWGGRMADDITDGVKKLIDTGQADPKRICIFGASYGGYAALYAGATHPELYKCVVSWAGVSDLTAALKYERSDGADSERYKWWVKLIGDPATDGDALRKASPITYAATYGPPVLLIHGDSDQRVQPEQSHMMEKALKRAGKDVRLIIYKNEDHTDWSTDHEKAAINEVDKFIEAHIAPAKAAAPAAAPTTVASGTAPAAAH